MVRRGMSIENAPRVAVDSSNITEVAHDEKTRTLRVWFQNGAVYDYDGVPRQTYTGLLSAESVGKYFHVHVRNSYDYRRV